MLENWIPLQRYKLLRSSEDDETAANMPRMRLADWFALRRVRTALIVVALLLIVFSLSRFMKMENPGLHYSEPPQRNNGSTPATGDDGVRWSDFAYVQYVTNGNYLCNSLMILEALHRSGTKADRIMMYPEDWHISGDAPDASTESKLLSQSRDLYEAKLVPIQVQTITKGDATWKDSLTKLLAFNQTQYKRVMSLDSDATVRQVSISSTHFSRRLSY